MLGLYLASILVPGVQIVGTGTFILASVLLGLVNAFVRPVAILLTLPITVVTLGLFLFVLNRLIKQSLLVRQYSFYRVLDILKLHQNHLFQFQFFHK